MILIRNFYIDIVQLMSSPGISVLDFDCPCHTSSVQLLYKTFQYSRRIKLNSETFWNYFGYEHVDNILEF